MHKTKIIAEIGCNHNGNVDLARKMIDEAKKCGVDAVKFQTFNAKELISKYAPKAEYQKRNTGEKDTQLEMTAKLELKQDDYVTLKEYAQNIGLEVFSTPFDLESVDFLMKNGQKIWKIPSGEINNLPYLEKIGAIYIKEKQILLSTGMANKDEIMYAINILQKKCNNKIVILHCNTEYPTPDEDVNISAIVDLKRTFRDYEIGFSDHSVGTTAATMAMAYGVSIIEKHFTLDKSMDGPDHKASATPNELKQLVFEVRRAEKMLGCGEKIVTESEKKNINIARKSIVAKCKIKKGDAFNEKNITCKRPGGGVSPIYWYDVIGKIAQEDYEEDEMIKIYK